MTPEDCFRRYRQLQSYVGWTEEDARRVGSLAGLLQAHLPPLVEDFYAEIERHPGARKVITGGQEQIDRLKGTLIAWLDELLRGQYDAAYVVRRWRVGWRHVEIGLEQVYTGVAMARLRTGLVRVLEENWPPGGGVLAEHLRSLNTLMDLDLALITEAYQEEYLLRQQRTERLAAIGQVAGGVAHELRNPLNVVKTSVYYLLNARNATPEKKAEHLQRIEQNVTRADGVITALSRFAKLPVPDLLPVRMQDCLREALDANPVPDRCRVVLDFSPGVPAALADADQVRIVLGNLIRNAHEAMPQGGILTLGVSLNADRVEVTVSDTGGGIPPELLPRITEPLYSTKARGLGLGLAIARSILEKNQGELRIASQPGQGSTFTVSLRADAGGPPA
jgi:signal transduction histidine kinase